MIPSKNASKFDENINAKTELTISIFLSLCAVPHNAAHKYPHFKQHFIVI
jgi:hypothetical protein